MVVACVVVVVVVVGGGSTDFTRSRNTMTVNLFSTSQTLFNETPFVGSIAHSARAMELHAYKLNCTPLCTNDDAYRPTFPVSVNAPPPPPPPPTTHTPKPITNNNKTTTTTTTTNEKEGKSAKSVSFERETTTVDGNHNLHRRR